MNKLFLTIFTVATASFAPMQAMMLSALRTTARPALPQAQRPILQPAPHQLPHVTYADPKPKIEVQIQEFQKYLEDEQPDLYKILGFADTESLAKLWAPRLKLIAGRQKLVEQQLESVLQAYQNKGFLVDPKPTIFYEDKLGEKKRPGAHGSFIHSINKILITQNDFTYSPENRKFLIAHEVGHALQDPKSKFYPTILHKFAQKIEHITLGVLPHVSLGIIGLGLYLGIEPTLTNVMVAASPCSAGLITIFTQLATSYYLHKSEYDADKKAAIALDSTKESIEFFEQYIQRYKLGIGDRIASFIDTHPSPHARIRALRKIEETLKAQKELDNKTKEND